MFQSSNAQTDYESSERKTRKHQRIPMLAWIFAAILGVAFVVGGTGSVALAAGVSPSVDTRPLLKVVPKQVGIPGDGINCTGPHSGAYAWICHVTLTELKSSSTSLHWYTRSDRPAKFSPSSGYLSPGQSVKVIISTNFCGGYTNFYFVGPKNVATVTYQCG